MIVLWLVGCMGAGVPEVRPGPPLVRVTDVASFEVDALLPTDLLPLPGDALLVLDGYRHRAVVVDAGGQVVRTLGDPAWGHPVRITAREGGYWLADPGDDDTQPALLAIREDGTPEHGVVVRDGEVEVRPVSVAAGLAVGDRDGRIRWVDPDGLVTDTLDIDVDGAPLGAIVDLVAFDGGWLAVDALGHRVHGISPGHEPTGAWGRFGEWPGTFQRVTSAAPTPRDNVLITDSALGVVQLFAQDGPSLGLVADGEPLRFDHPVAVRADDDDPSRFYVLDSTAARVVTFRLSDVDEAVAETQRHVRYLRVSLARDPVEPGEKLCFQCHDGLVVDSRAHWDPDRTDHPVDVTPEHVTVPDALPLAEGRVVCTTCHSPHGMAGDATFLRGTTSDSGLCVACHGTSAHERLVEGLGIPGGGHPVGEALKQALGDHDPLASGECLDCHAAHGAAGDPLLRDDGGGLCVACHGDQAASGRNHPTGRRLGRDVPRPREGAALVLSRDGGLQCRTCHDLVGGRTDALLRTPRDGGALCLACHADPEGYAESPHAGLAKSGPSCLACHDPHGVAESQHFLRTVGKASAGDPNGCAACHGPGGRAPTAAGVAGHPTVAGSGERAVAGCATCHDAHAARLPDAAACGSCHAEQGAAHARGGHGTATCLDCHPAHGQPRLAASPDPQAARCLACHGEGAVGATRHVARFDHPAPLFLPDGSRWKPLGSLPLFDAAGRPVAPGDNGTLSCGSCHETHGPGPDGRGELRRDGWKEACAACHGTDALTLYRDWHRPEKRGGP